LATIVIVTTAIATSAATAFVVSAVDAAIADDAVAGGGGGGRRVYADFDITAPIRPVGAIGLAVLFEDSSNPFFRLLSPPDTTTISSLSSTSTTSIRTVYQTQLFAKFHTQN
jgi:hypothetical protein